ncbi:zinc dependent phospholipase C family protein [Clostridium grantii]|uniref:Phospholipase C n=1 Tax=Clostridium grantii DSM 8605 TaxID=1121316 RepID=A0A1M5RG38_9CLOT|nr:zinc dependent phospholipase C family protein [Clostridium grantii]SHH25317.1 phospholipase C [Clostridium grantii DSM 8605]
MKKKIEHTFGKTIKSVMFAVNPIKKLILKTHCITHKYINDKSVIILKNEGYQKEYEFFKSHLKCINEGVTWADQDFKSSNHFYHYEKQRGLYGFSNALDECLKYYDKALAYIEAGDMNKGVFFFGASCHLIQDATVPQHVSNHLLNKHRNFELWIISKILSNYPYGVEKGIKDYESVDMYVKKNAVFANKIDMKYDYIKNIEMRYKKISEEILREAQITTAGFMLDFYRVINKEK